MGVALEYVLPVPVEEVSLDFGGGAKAGGGGLGGGAAGVSLEEVCVPVDGVSLLLRGDIEDDKGAGEWGGAEEKGGTEDAGGMEDTGPVEDAGGEEDVRGVLEYELTVAVEEPSLLPAVGVDVSESELVVSVGVVSLLPGGGSLPPGGGLPKDGGGTEVVSGDELPEEDISLLLGVAVGTDNVTGTELSVGVASLLVGGDEDGVFEDDGVSMPPVEESVLFPGGRGRLLYVVPLAMLVEGDGFGMDSTWYGGGPVELLAE